MYPSILEIGPITIHTYGVLLALAFIAGIWLASRNAKKHGIDPDAVWSLGLVVIFAALVGTKLLMILSDFNYYIQNPREIFSLSTLRSMGVYYGGLLLALGAAAWYLNRKRLPAWKIADCAAPGIALGQTIGRLGCFASGCCYGAPTTMPWGVTFTNPYSYENVGVPLNIPLHPAQLYESAGTLCLFAFLMWRLSRKHTSGQIILEYLGLYAILRFALEFYRDDYRGSVLHGLLSTSQFIAVVTFIGAAVVYYFIVSRSGTNPKN
ncbi:MAG TPA: prolipoprotein diacylglyceryl transferase [Acidobacteriota bacterium]|nr:prolipoprotein diacylglyceryl transferase [Acidobacteriota bacterium]